MVNLKQNLMRKYFCHSLQFYFRVWTGNWIWLFTHFGAIKSLRQLLTDLFRLTHNFRPSSNFYFTPTTQYGCNCNHKFEHFTQTTQYKCNWNQKWKKITPTTQNACNSNQTFKANENSNKDTFFIYFCRQPAKELIQICCSALKKRG